MDSDRADAVSVLADEDLFLVRVDIVYLIGVSGSEYDHVILQVVDIKALKAAHTVAPKELLVPTGDRGVGDDLLLVAGRVKLVCVHLALGLATGGVCGKALIRGNHNGLIQGAGRLAFYIHI
jgi:hypothetical protein